MLKFKTVNQIVKSFHAAPDTYSILGELCFNFLNQNSHKEILISAPYFSQYDPIKLQDYIKDIIYLYFIQPTKSGHKSKFILSRKSILKNSDFIFLKHLKSYENFNLWEGNVLTSGTRFLPMFSDITIYNSKSQKLKSTIPILSKCFINTNFQYNFDLPNETFFLTLNNSRQTIDDKIGEESLPSSANYSNEEAEDLESNFLQSKIKTLLNITYPHSFKPHRYLYEEIGEKRILIDLSKSLNLQRLEKNEYRLLPQEITNNSFSITNFIEVKTYSFSESNSMYRRLQELKKEWRDLNINKFQNPFPSYWFLFVNNSLTSEEWNTRFIIDYPILYNHPILNSVKTIIEGLVQINWINKIDTNYEKLYFNSTNRIKKAKYNFESFKSVLDKKGLNIIEKPSDFDEKTQYSLESFSLKEIYKLFQVSNFSSQTVLVPDFLFFAINPALEYLLLKKEVEIIGSPLRKIVSNKTNSSLKKLEELKANSLINIRKRLRLFLGNKNSETIDSELRLIENPFDIGPILSKHGTEKKENRKIKLYIINTDNSVRMPSPKQEVLIRGVKIFATEAYNLEINDEYILLNDVLDKSSNTTKNLSSYPKNILNFQRELGKRKNAFKSLQKLGVSYIDQNYFHKTYINDDEEKIFKIPRRKRDWHIITKYLNINSYEANISYLNYYSNKESTFLKKIYEETIKIMLDHRYFGGPIPEEIKTSIKIEIAQLFDSNNDETNEISIEEIIESISNSFSFKTVKKIALNE